MKEKFYLTTAIIYTNAAPHIGFAYELLIGDIIARHRRAEIGKDNVYFLTGTDEHGTKIAKTAEEKGIDTQKFVDENAGKVKELIEKLGISNDSFIRTSSEIHKKGAQKLWVAISKDLDKRKYSGLYCTGCEAFKTDKELVNGVCEIHGTKPSLVEEENYFFKMGEYLPKIKEKIENNEIKIIPESRKHEILSLLDDGFEDVSFSRNVKANPWGIPVPNDSTQTMYVWCDALSNYITALGYADNNENFEKFWQDKSSQKVHLIGKDILRFHSIIWPAMLMSAGLELPKEILVHGFITVDGKKMSKSLGNVIDPMALIEKYGVEAFRYYFAREISPFEDGDFSEKKFIEAYNANLADGLGNLVSRIMKLAQMYLDGPVEIVRRAMVVSLDGLIDPAMADFNVQVAMDGIWTNIGKIDERIQTKAPFKVIKENKEEGILIIQEVARDLFILAKDLEPFLPNTAQTIQKLMRENKMPDKPLFPRIDSDLLEKSEEDNIVC